MLVETETAAVRLVATDRYRLAVAATPAQIEGPLVRLVLPLRFVDALRSHLTDPLVDGPLILDLTADTARAEFAGQAVTGEPAGADFPDYRRMVHSDSSDGRRLPVDTAALRQMIAADSVIRREDHGTSYPVSILGVDPAGRVRLAGEEEWAADPDVHVAVNREFLLQALDAGGAGQLVLELDGPIKPLAIRLPDDATRFSILMPVRH